MGVKGLVERERELDILLGFAEEASVGRGRLVLVEGPAGIGKSRLLAAARELGAEAGLHVLNARGSELEREFPFGVVRQLLEPLVSGLGEAEAERRRVFEGAARHARPLFEAGDVGTVGSADPGYATLYGLYWLVCGLAQRQALLLCVDDVHWADAPSLRFLAFLAGRLEGLPVLVVGALRPAEHGTDRSLLAALATDPGIELLRPRPLTSEGVRQLARLELGRKPEPEFVEACQKASGGNPFYLRALLAEVAARGIEPTAAEAGRVRQLGPQSVTRLLLCRLDSLPGGGLELARAVAVLGEGTTLGRATRLAGLDEVSAAETAVALERAGLISGGQQLSFVHPVVRSCVYSDIPAALRAERHAAAARLLTEEGATPEEVAGQLLHTQAGTQPDAGEVLAAAAERALRRGAPETAATYLERSLAEPLPCDERALLRSRLGQAQARFDPASAVGHLRGALEQSDAPASARATAAQELGRLLTVTGRTPEAVDVLGREADHLTKVAPELAARLEAELVSVGCINFFVRPLVAQRAGRLVDSDAGGSPLLADVALAWRACEATLSGYSAEEAATLAERALASGRLRAEGLAGGTIFFYIVSFLTVAERFDTAARYLDRAVEEARRAGSVVAYVIASAQRSLLGYQRGTLTEAEADARSALEAARLNRLGPLELMAVTALSDVLIERGEDELAAGEMTTAPVEAAARECPQGNMALEARGRLRLALGQTEAGVADLTEAGERFVAWGLHNTAAFAWRSNLALGLHALGRDEEALQVADKDVRLARCWGTPRGIGVALRGRGLVVDGEERLELLREAAEVLAGSQAQLEYARSLCDLGAELRRSGYRTDARALLTQALELARTCGATVLEETARTELTAAGARPRRAVRTGWDALTASERRIVEMAAAGYSNPEIAQALFLTVKTVEGHLSGAYRKLDVRSRGELAKALQDART